MVKKIMTTLVLALTFSYGLSVAHAEDKSTTSNAVTSFYGEYIEKPKDDVTPKDPTPPSHNNGGTGNINTNDRPDNTTNTGNVNHNTGTTSKDVPGKVIPHTGNTPQVAVQLVGGSMFVTLVMALGFMKRKGEL